MGGGGNKGKYWGKENLRGTGVLPSQSIQPIKQQQQKKIPNIKPKFKYKKERKNLLMFQLNKRGRGGKRVRVRLGRGGLVLGLPQVWVRCTGAEVCPQLHTSTLPCNMLRMNVTVCIM